MSSNIKSFSVGYDPINESNIFTSGDRITGRITLELAKCCQINSLCIKLKGKAEVKWTENYGKIIVTYHNKDKYFSVKQFIIEASQSDKIVQPGSHVYPFTFNIPAQELPSSFKGSYGKIVYKLEAVLSRSMRVNSKAKAHLTLIHNGTNDQLLKIPQRGVTEKTLKLFTSGTVGMDVNIDRTAFRPGEGIKVVASIHNKSSRPIQPKYYLYSKYSYFAKQKRKVETKKILKEVGEAIPPSAGQTVTRTITIPPTTGPSILNCSIIMAEYRLRVYLDVKYNSDPEIKLPIVILPASQGCQEENSPYGFDGFRNSGMAGGTNFL